MPSSTGNRVTLVKRWIKVAIKVTSRKAFAWLPLPIFFRRTPGGYEIRRWYRLVLSWP